MTISLGALYASDDLVMLATFMLLLDGRSGLAAILVIPSVTGDILYDGPIVICLSILISSTTS